MPVAGLPPPAGFPPKPAPMPPLAPLTLRCASNPQDTLTLSRAGDGHVELMAIRDGDLAPIVLAMPAARDACDWLTRAILRSDAP